MSGLLGFFLRPPDLDDPEPDVPAPPSVQAPVPPPPPPASPAGTTVIAAPPPPVALTAVLCAPDELWPAAGMVAGALRSGLRSPAAVVCAWKPGGFDPDDVPPAPASRAARRLERRLSDRGLAAAACGALSRVTLPADAQAAVRAAGAAIAAAGGPVVLALALNDGAFDGLLAECGETYVVLSADADPALRELTPGARNLKIVATPGTPVARLRARLGLGRIGPLVDGVAATVSPAPSLPPGFAPPRPPQLEPR